MFQVNFTHDIELHNNPNLTTETLSTCKQYNTFSFYLTLFFIVKPRCRKVAVDNPEYDLSPNIEFYKLWQKIIKAGRLKDLKLLFKGKFSFSRQSV